LEKAEQKRQKEYLLKNLEDEKRERREKVIYTVPADSLLYTES
jgi:hypothetical protein